MSRALASAKSHDCDVASRLANDGVTAGGRLRTRVRGIGEPDQDGSRPRRGGGQRESSGGDERGAHLVPFGSHRHLL